MREALWGKGIGKDRRVGKLSFLEKLRLPQSFSFFAVSGVVLSTPLFWHRRLGHVCSPRLRYFLSTSPFDLVSEAHPAPTLLSIMELPSPSSFFYYNGKFSSYALFLYTGALFLLFLSAISLIAGWLHLQPKWKPSVSWFQNAESRLNHYLSGLFGVSSLAWTGHLVHVAIPGARGEYVRWNNFLDVLPHPQGLGPLFTGQWNLYAQNPDSNNHLFGTSQGAGTTILTLLGGFHPQTQSLWLTDIAHHHLAIEIIFLIAGHMYRTNFGIGHSIKDLLEAHIPPGGRLGRGHKGLYDTINN